VGKKRDHEPGTPGNDTAYPDFGECDEVDFPMIFSGDLFGIQGISGMPDSARIPAIILVILMMYIALRLYRTGACEPEKTGMSSNVKDCQKTDATDGGSDASTRDRS
jgi:hypothetical protein